MAVKRRPGSTCSGDQNGAQSTTGDTLRLLTATLCVLHLKSLLSFPPSSARSVVAVARDSCRARERLLA
jgi:hypothetical protein